jgi:hypothetical protein
MTVWSKIGEAALSGLCAACASGAFLVGIIMIIAVIGFFSNLIGHLSGGGDDE